jgi:hypothetical protein
METKEPVNDSEKLKQGLVMRIGLVVVGCVIASILAVVIPALYLAPVRSEVFTGPPPPPPPVPLTAYLPPVIMLALLILIVYGIYDAIRMFMRYRKSQQDEQMFP